LLVVALFAALLEIPSHRRRWMVSLAAAPGFLFLAFIANDFSRWTVLASFNAWLFHAATDAGGWLPEDKRLGLLRIGIAVFVILLIHPRTLRVAYPIYVPSPMIDNVAEKLGLPATRPVFDALARCDPHWRDVLTPPPQ
jgi:hypothetical protein